MPGAVLPTGPATFFAASKPAGDVEWVTQFVQANALVVNTCSYRHESSQTQCFRLVSE